VQADDAGGNRRCDDRVGILVRAEIAQHGYALDGPAVLRPGGGQAEVAQHVRLDAQHVPGVLAALIFMVFRVLLTTGPVPLLSSFRLPAARQPENEHDHGGDGGGSHFSPPARASSSNRARAASSWRAV